MCKNIKIILIRNHGENILFTLQGISQVFLKIVIKKFKFYEKYNQNCPKGIF